MSVTLTHPRSSPNYMKNYGSSPYYMNGAVSTIFLFRAYYVHDLNSHPILYHDRFAIARCDPDDLILNGDWLALANNLNQTFLILSIFSDFLTCDFHFATDKVNFA